MNTTAPPELMTSLRALPKAAWFVFAGTFINRMGSLVMPFVTLYLTRHDFTIDQAGWALLSYGVGNLVATLLGGHLADSIGRRNTMLFSLFSTTVVMCLIPHAETIRTIYTLMFFTGVTGEMYRPAVNALIADIVPEEHRLAAYAANRTALNAGFAFGPSLGGFLAVYSWDLIFYADALTTGLYALIALYALPHGRRSDGSANGTRSIWREIMNNVPFLLFALSSFLVGVTFMQINSTYSLQIVNAGFDPWVFGVFTSFNGLLVVCIELPLVSITRRYSPKVVIVVGYALIGIGMALAVGSKTIPHFFVVMVVFTLGEIISMPMIPTLLARIAPEDSRGRYMGVFGLTWAFALVIGPKAGLVVYAINPDLWWYICGAIGILAAVLMTICPLAHRSDDGEKKS